MDSYMYQTVGQDAIEIVAQALDVPLVRRVITGTAVEQGSEYGTRDARVVGKNSVSGDETEDMYALLAEVKVCMIREFVVCDLNLRRRSDSLRLRVSRWARSCQATSVFASSMCAYVRFGCLAYVLSLCILQLPTPVIDSSKLPMAA